LAVRFIPIRLVAEHLPLFPVQQLGDLSTVVHACCAERPAIFIRQLLERYAIEAIPTKAPAMQRGDNLALVNLRKVFGDLRLDELQPRHIYKYVDTRMNKQGQKSVATGLHEPRVFKHAFTKAVEWGPISFKAHCSRQSLRPRWS
jgi:hypothetical protein